MPRYFPPARSLPLAVGGCRSTNLGLAFETRSPAERVRLIKETCDGFPTAAEANARALVEDCLYLNAVCEESLRIYLPAGAAHLTRIVPNGGCDIKPGGQQGSQAD
ncbi:hypothetical protein DL766_010223 [Monosporascus sp. MC13-8B]|nr:hypothetical protein DL766_010223 [Monosporascus sp. MC13-8B]